MASKSRQRGKAFEYRIRDWFRRAGLPAERVPVSGSARALKGDVMVEVRGRQLSLECKRRTGGLRQLVSWLDKARKQGSFAVVVGVGRRKPLVVLELDKFLELLAGYGPPQNKGP
jgi:Holliday junction resolvase